MTDPLEAESYVAGKKRSQKEDTGRVGQGAASHVASSGAGGKGFQDAMQQIDKYHSGGKVRKTGLARLKKGERVLTKGQQRRMLKGRGGKSR